MSKAVTFFFICLGLMGGIVLWVYEIPFLFIFPISIVVILLGVLIHLISGHPGALLGSICFVCVLLGFAYASVWSDRKYEPLLFGREIIFEGTVRSYPRQTEFGKGFILETVYGNVQMYTSFVSEAEYGDSFVLRGITEELSEMQQYLKKDRMVGVIKNPELVGFAQGKSSFVRELYRFRKNIRDMFVRTLPYDEASLATGLLIGGGSISFSQDLKGEMQNSGTTHIVALSGYNVSIIILWVYAILGCMCSRRWTFWLTIGTVGVFTIMTGAETSIVRASIMGILCIVSQHVGRVYSFRQSAAAVACLMLISNPYAIRYDAGFSLSFLSLFGIVYLAPLFLYSVRKFWFASLEWTKIMCETIAAQLAVLPVLIFLFDGFSVSAIIANALILPAVPIAMGLSFGVVCVGFFSSQLAHIMTFILQPSLEYVLEIVRIFGSVEQTQFSKSIMLSVLYYIAIVCVAAYAKKKRIWFSPIQR